MTPTERMNWPFNLVMSSASFTLTMKIGGWVNWLMAGRVTFHPITSWTKVRFMPHGLGLIWKCLATCNTFAFDWQTPFVWPWKWPALALHSGPQRPRSFLVSTNIYLCVGPTFRPTWEVSDSCPIWQMWLPENTNRMLLACSENLLWPEVTILAISRPLGKRMLRFWCLERTLVREDIS